MDRKIFFDNYRTTLDKDGKFTQQEVSDIDTFLNFFEKDIKKFSLKQWAYIFASVYHETAFTFHPVRESPRASEDWRKRNLRYYPYYGRGYIQITWDYNYAAYQKKTGIPLVKEPDLAMIPSTSWFILTDGFKYGVFTGKKISDYINDKKTDYLNARRCINGTDKAAIIKSYAETFESILKKSVKWQEI